MTNAPYRLSLAMIVRDEARCITRCLESVSRVVDEMVVMDTGSSDDTVALARAAGAEVHEMTWPDDFAQARNAVLERCTGDWVLVLDADEYLVEGARELRGLRELAPEFLGYVAVQNEIHGYRRVNRSMQARVLPASVRYEGRIHEQPVHAGPQRLLHDVVLSHDGYEPAQLERKAGRNHALLAAALEESPRDAYLRYQMGVDRSGVGDMREAAKHLRIAYRRSGPTSLTTPRWRHDLVLRFLRALVETGATQEALDVADAELPHFVRSADMNLQIGHVLLAYTKDHPRGVSEMLKLVESCWLTALELGDTLDWEGSVRGAGTWLPAENLAVLYENLGTPGASQRYRAMAEKHRRQMLR